jgi:4-amino-4-deoxy-L-arabinose transferase-like glycosyltransferase
LHICILAELMIGIKNIIFKYRNLFSWIGILCVLAIPLFGFLDTMPLRIYDEARLAINAYEMAQSGNYIVTTYDGNPDLWNTKPPFFIWTQVALIKLIGFNEISLRLPSAFAGLLIIIVLIRFCRRYLNSFFLGFLTFLVIISSAGFISIHGTRTGDYDVMVGLFMLLYSLSYFLYLEYGKIKYILFFGLFLGLAVLTKSVVGLMFLPALALYTVTSKNLIRILKDKQFYLGVFISILIIGSFYTVREIIEPGYIQAVQENELGGRYLKTIEEHKHPFSYYWDNFTERNFSHWYLLFFLGMLLGLRNSNLKIRRISILSSMIVLSFFFIISTAQTKLNWYDIPMYPFLSLITGIALFEIYNLISLIRITRNKIGFEVLALVFLLVVAYEPYRKVFKSTYLPKELQFEAEYYQISYFLKDAIRGKYDLKNKVFIHDNYHPQTTAYIHVLNNQGINITEKYFDNLEVGDHVIVHQEIAENFINENYQNEKTDEVGKVRFYTIKGIKYVD